MMKSKCTTFINNEYNYLLCDIFNDFSIGLINMKNDSYSCIIEILIGEDLNKSFFKRVFINDVCERLNMIDSFYQDNKEFTVSFRFSNEFSELSTCDIVLTICPDSNKLRVLVHYKTIFNYEKNKEYIKTFEYNIDYLDIKNFHSKFKNLII